MDVQRMEDAGKALNSQMHVHSENGEKLLKLINQ